MSVVFVQKSEQCLACCLMQQARHSREPVITAGPPPDYYRSRTHLELLKVFGVPGEERCLELVLVQVKEVAELSTSVAGGVEG